MASLPSLHSPFWAPDAEPVIATATEAMTVAALGACWRRSARSSVRRAPCAPQTAPLMPGVLAAAAPVAGVSGRVPARIILVIGLGRVEARGAAHRRHHPAAQDPVRLGPRRLGVAPLRRVEREDRGAIALAAVAELAAAVGRVDRPQEAAGELRDS